MTNKINKIHGVLIEDVELTERVDKLEKEGVSGTKFDSLATQVSETVDDLYEITDTHEENFEKINNTLNTLADEITNVKGGVTKQLMSILPVIDLTYNDTQDNSRKAYYDYETQTVDNTLYLVATSPKQETQLSEDEISTLAESLVSFPCILRPSANVKMMSTNLCGTVISFNTPSNMSGSFTIDTKYAKYEESNTLDSNLNAGTTHPEGSIGYIYKFYFPYTEATESA